MRRRGISQLWKVRWQNSCSLGVSWRVGVVVGRVVGAVLVLVRSSAQRMRDLMVDLLQPRATKR